MSLRAAQAVAGLCLLAALALRVPALARLAAELVPTPEARGLVVLGVPALVMAIAAAAGPRHRRRG